MRETTSAMLPAFVFAALCGAAGCLSTLRGESSDDTTDWFRSIAEGEAEGDFNRNARVVVMPRLNLTGGVDGDTGYYSLAAGPYLHAPLCGTGASIGLRFRGRLGVMLDFDRMSAYDPYDPHSLTENAVRFAAYVPLGTPGLYEMSVGARCIYEAALIPNEPLTAWRGGRGFGIDVALTARIALGSRGTILRGGVRHDWLEFAEREESGVSVAVADRAQIFCLYFGVEFRL